jgi:hypothetical protein
VTFTLDGYESVALHLRPELMRAAEAQTVVLHPVGTPPASADVPQPASAPRLAPTPPAAPPSPAPRSASPPNGPASPPPSVPVPAVTPASPPTPGQPAPPEPLAAYLVGMNATSVLRASLADFLDAAGDRRDVRVSVGVATGRQVTWVLRDEVPYGVRAMPRYPDLGPAPDPSAALAAVSAAVVADATDPPARRRRQLVVLVWDRWPEPVATPVSLRSALLLHCVDAVLSPPASNGSGGSSWILARTRPGPRPSLLAHTGRLLDRWEDFVAVPAGLALSPFAVRSV